MQNDQFLEFAKAFDRAAKHIFSPARAENLLSCFLNELMQSPEDFESDAEAIRVRHAFALARHAEVNREIAGAPQGEPHGALTAERAALQGEIHNLASLIKSPAILEAYRGAFKKARDARHVWDCIFGAVRDESLAIYLKPATPLTIICSPSSRSP